MAGPAPVLVMSYNISHEAMAHGTNQNFSAYKLGRKCDFVIRGKKSHEGLTSCAQNMAKFIDTVPALKGVSSFDFVGLQEASNWSYLKKASKALTSLEAHASEAAPEYMASFFDGAKYTLQTKVEGQFHTGRPFQILVLQAKAGGGVIFINVHYKHDHTRVDREDAFDDIAQHLSAALEAKGVDAAAKAYRIIAVGDYNEAGWVGGKLVTPQWAPLNAGAPHIATTISIGATPWTCSQSTGVWEDKGVHRQGQRGGDYVFDSAAAAPVEVPSTYPWDELCSDHLPVIAKL